MATGSSGRAPLADAFVSGRAAMTSVGVPSSPLHHTSRSRLFRLLEDRRQITTVIGAAGFGKTTLVGGWLAQSPTAGNVAWISLEDIAGDRHLFLTKLLAAIRAIQPDACDAPNAMLGDLRPAEPRAVVTSLLNDLGTREEKWTFVLEDYPADDDRIGDLVGYAGDRLPANIGLVIIARGTPLLPLPRWRVKQRLTEIGIAELRFTPEETRDFITKAMKLPLGSDALALLDHRAEGWVAGLQLAALWLSGRKDVSETGAMDLVAFDGQHRFVADYLAAEVFANQDEETRRFLLATSVVDRFTAGLCEAIFGSGSRIILERLRQRGLFVMALDDRDAWCRYHQLFKEFLRAQSQSEAVVSIHRRASEWFEKENQPGEAIRHAVAGEDIPRAVAIFKAHLDSELAAGRFYDVLLRLNMLPESTVRQDTELSGYKAWLLYLRGRVGEAETYSEIIGARSDIPIDALPVPLIAFRAFVEINRGRIKQAGEAANAALAGLNGSPSFFSALSMSLLGAVQRIAGDRASAITTLRAAVRLGEKHGNSLVKVEATSDLIPLMYASGRLHEALQLCKETIEDGAANARSMSGAGLLHIRYGQLLYERDELDHARAVIEQGLELCHRLGSTNYIYLGKRHLAQIVHARGEHERARNLLAEAAQFADRAEHVRQRRMIDLCLADFLLREDNVPAAANLIGTVADWDDDVTEFEQLVYVRLLLAQDRPRIADDLLGRMEIAARRDSQLRALFVILILRSLAAERRGETTAAEHLLIEALTLGAPFGYLRSLLDLGPPVLGILRRVKPVCGYAGQFIARFSAQPLQSGLSHVQSLLTITENKILQLLAQGMSNRDIAARLSISVGTAKWHVHHIYQKLDVPGRTAAVYRARELQLLEA